jgi:hypothetical protein
MFDPSAASYSYLPNKKTGYWRLLLLAQQEDWLLALVTRFQSADLSDTEDKDAGQCHSGDPYMQDCQVCMEFKVAQHT